MKKNSKEELFPEPTHEESLQEYLERVFNTKPTWLTTGVDGTSWVPKEAQALYNSPAARHWHAGPYCKICKKQTLRANKICSNLKCQEQYMRYHP